MKNYLNKILISFFVVISLGFSQDNYSLSFDGYGDYVDLGNNSLFDFQYGDPFTISMWIYPNALGGDQGLISKMADGGPVQYEVITDGASIRYGTGNQFLFGGQLEAGNWYHLIVTSDGSAKNIYINNQLIESGTFESMTSNGDNLYIGAHQPLSVPGWSWNGFIDEVSIWDIALSQNEIDDNVTNGLNGNENGLVSYYKFNEGAGGTLLDDGPNGINGVINGAIWSSEVPILPVLGCTDSYADNFNSEANSDDGSCSGYPDNGDYSLSFDGENDYIDFGTSATTEISSDISIVAWFKLNNFNNGLSTLIMKESTSLSDNNAYGINKTYNGNGLDFVIGDGNSNNVVSTQELQPDKWYYLVCTNDGVTSKIYIDGILHDEISSGNPAGPNENLKMGLHSTLSTSDRYWNGAIDNVSLWNVALDQDQIQFYMSNKPAGDEAGLVADWRFNSGAGDMLYDHSGNQNHGTINGSIWSEDIYVPPIPPVPGGNNFLSFDGADDYVEIESFELGQSFSFDTEFYLPEGDYGNSDAGKTIFSYGPANDGWEAFSFGISSTGQHTSWNEPTLIVEFGRYNNYQYAADRPIDLNASHHILISFNEGNLIVFQDGIEVINLETLSELQDNSANRGFDIGRRTNDGQYFPGSINYLRIWNEAVGEDELIDILNGNEFSNDNFKANWKFDTGEGNILFDESGNQNHGTIYGATWIGGVPVPLVFGCTDPYANNFNSDANVDDGSCSGYPDNGQYSLSFDGENDFVSIPLSSSLNLNQFDTLSIAALFKINSFDNEMGLLSFGDTGSGITVAVSNEGQLMSWFPGYTVGDRTEQLYPDIWYNVIVTYATGETGFKKIYINGELQVDEYYSYAFYPNQNNSAYLGIGDQFNGYEGRYFDGFVGNVTLFSRELRQSEINDSMFDEDGVMGSWNFNEGEDNLLHDNSGNQNHGIINGPTWSEDVYVPPIPPVIGGNNSLSFDGVDDYISVNQFNRAGSNDLTINVYAKGQGTMTCPRTSGYESYFGYAVNDSRNQIFFHMGVLTPQSGFNWDVSQDYSNEYHFYSIVLDDLQNGSTLAKLYVDGVSIGQHTYPYSIQSFSEMEIGRNIVEQNGFYNGNISEIQFWDRVLSVQEIQFHMVNSPSGDEEDLFSFWSFNEGQGSTLTDLTSNGYNGNIYGANWSGDVPVPPVFGCTDTYADNYNPEATYDDGSCFYPDNGNYSLSFDGVDDYVKIDGLDEFLPNNIFVGAWVNVSSLSNTDENSPVSGDVNIVSKYDGSLGKSWNLCIQQSSSKPYFNFRHSGGGNRTVFADTEINLGEWYYIAGSWDGANLNIYVNGILENSQDESGGQINPSSSNIIIGASGEGTAGLLYGVVDEVFIAETALSEEQIRSYMNQGISVQEESLIAYWKFNSGEGSTLYDHSGNVNHGTINGTTWSDDFPYTGPEWYVSKQGDDSNNGSEDQPFESIQTAINSAGNGHIVLVAPGTYFENINYNGKNIIVSAEAGPEETVINGGQNGTVVVFNSGESIEAILDGFTITNGGGPSSIGGGIAIVNSSPMISNVIVEHNSDMQGYGGGIDLNGETETIISNSIVRNNTALWGGGIYCHSSNPTIEYVVVSGNHSTTNAGGIYARDNSSPTINNCTIVNNSTDGLGGGILTWYNSVPEVKNSIIRGNTPTQIDHVTGGAVNLSYSNVEGYHEGNNNIDESPLFCNVSNDDYSLSQDSPCIGTGESGTDIGALGVECEEPHNNYSLSFNGQDNYVEINNDGNIDFDINSSFTINTWFKTSVAYEGLHSIISKADPEYGYLGWQLGFTHDNGGSLLFVAYNSSSSENIYLYTGHNNLLSDNKWHFVSLSINQGVNGSIDLFIDGQLSSSWEGDLNLNIASNTNILFGVDRSQNNYFNGQLDEISVYDIALDQEEIQSHMNSELLANEEGLVGYWNFNSGDGSLLVDVLGDGNDGQISGASWTMGAPLDPAQIISGCDDPYAENFNPEVNTNDGSCEYSQEPLTFTKENYADPNLAENQDRITADIWITRGDSMSLYNAAQEEYYQADSISPEGTVWASGLTALHLSIDEYKSFKQATGGGHQNLPGRTLSMHILGTDLFYDIEFHDWSSGGNGGGFSYTRTPAELNTYDYPEDTVFFEKADYADWQLEENQDRIAVNTWLTRGDQGGLFNAYSEEGYETSSPENTEWFFGHTDSVYNEQYISWEELVDTSSGIIGQFISLHILSENKYFDVVFHDWTGGDNGGGFSYTRMQIDVDTGPLVNGSISGTVIFASDSTAIEGALVVAVAEDSSYSGQVYTGSDGTYNMDLAGSLNYYVNISYDGLIDYNEYVFVAPFENTTVDASMDILVNGHVEGTITDWYTNAPLSGASVLFTYSDDEGGMETIESQADQDGYFMVQVPGEVDYDLFLYAEGYWVEHDAFFLSSGEHQVLSIGIAPITSASRLYGMVKDFETGEVIPYAQVQLNCEDASDWDHTGTLGTYRVFSYYPGDCADGVLVVSADGYQSSVQSVGSIDFVAGSSYDLEVELVAGGDPDPGMLSGTIFSNIDGNPIADAEIKAYSTLTTQLFSVMSSGDGSYELFLPESEYYISVSADNHQELFDTLSIVSGQALNYDFNLDEVYLNRVYGVIANQNGETIFDSRVVATVGEDRNIVAGTWSNENGEYELFMPNGVYDIGSGINDYLMKFEDGVELSGVDVNVSLTLESVQQFDGGIAGLVNINEDDNSTVWVNVFTNDYTYNAYVPSDENGAYSLPLINGTYNLFAWVPGSNYESIYIPNAFTVGNNVVNYDIYFIEPAGPESPTIVFLEDVLNDQGGQMDLAWTPGDPREFEVFPQYSVWRQDEEWTLLATVPYHGFDIYNMVVPTLGDSTDTGIVQSTFMVTAHTIDPNIFFDSEPMTGYSIDNIYPGVPDNLSAVFSGEVVQLDWSTPADDDISYYNIYRQDIGSSEPAIVFISEENTYTDEVGYLGDFEYWVTAVDLSGNESDPSDAVAIALSIASDYLPDEFALQQNYPNPFNPSTQIRYSLPVSSNVKVVVYNMLGSKVRTLHNGNQDAGYRSVMWNATNDNGDPVAAGMYIYTIEADGYFASKKMILLK